MGFLFSLYVGAKTVFCDGIRHIPENLKEYKVSVFVGVPLLIEAIYKKIEQGIEKQGKAKLVNSTIKLSNFLLKVFHIDIRRKLFKTILNELGLKDDEIKRNVLKLSGGQQQRVAIARTLVANSPVILADEPTGNLDSDTEEEIIEILKTSAHKHGKCVIVVTHSKDLASKSDVILELKDKKLVL